MGHWDTEEDKEIVNMPAPTALLRRPEELAEGEANVQLPSTGMYLLEGNGILHY